MLLCETWRSFHWVDCDKWAESAHKTFGYARGWGERLAEWGPFCFSLVVYGMSS